MGDIYTSYCLSVTYVSLIIHTYIHASNFDPQLPWFSCSPLVDPNMYYSITAESHVSIFKQSDKYVCQSTPRGGLGLVRFGTLNEKYYYEKYEWFGEL